LFLTNLSVSIVTTEAPVFLTAFVIKEILEILVSAARL